MVSTPPQLNCAASVATFMNLGTVVALLSVGCLLDVDGKAEPDGGAAVGASVGTSTTGTLKAGGSSAEEGESCAADDGFKEGSKINIGGAVEACSAERAAEGLIVLLLVAVGRYGAGAVEERAE